MNNDSFNLGSLLSRVSEFNIQNIELKENKTLLLTINVIPGLDLEKAEQNIKERFQEYEVKIVFCVQQMQTEKFKKIIGISSGKGGVGKSMTALNLAFTLRDLGNKVGLIDADAYSPSIAGLLNLKEVPKSSDGVNINPIKTHGIEVLSMGLFLKEGESQVWHEGTIGAVTSQFLVQSNWNCEYLILDFAGGMNEAYQACLKTCPNVELIMISQPNKMIYRDVIRMFALVKAMGLKVLGFVENMTNDYYPDEKLKEFDININHIKRIAKIPFLKSYEKFIENGYPEDYKMEDEESMHFKTLIRQII
ncbi:P-loop NTPase [Alphaproteobacteria bacterium endosymbiont of Tiliacea citrago]|uniref:P-loop NTPase n=1 Tax=Alphaproteobacteria bacterium endosymbiont of Tiliacea citrago TaxID=3077944 RepID=UPI00313EBB20